MAFNTHHHCPYDGHKWNKRRTGKKDGFEAYTDRCSCCGRMVIEEGFDARPSDTAMIAADGTHLRFRKGVQQ